LTPLQRRQVDGASSIRALRASINHGLPPLAATNRPGAFAGRGVVAARGAQGAPSRSTAVAANSSGRGSSAHAVSAGGPIGATRRAVSDSRQFHAPTDLVRRSGDPVRTSTHSVAAPQASRAGGNPPSSARSFPAQAPDRRWAESRMPHGNAASGPNFRPARDAQPAHTNVPAAPRNGRHS
jgi:hypothetical protein